MKNILIDLYKTKDLFSGLGQFSQNFANELALQLPPSFQANYLLPNKKQNNQWPKNITSTESTMLQRLLPFTNEKYSVWHSLHQFPSHTPPKKSAWILTIHDLNFMVEKSSWKREKYLHKLQKNVSRADYITTISNFTKKEILKHLEVGEKKIRVIHNGVVSGTGTKKVHPSFIGKEPFFFSIGIFNPKKNFKTLLPMMQHFKEYKLIIAGNKDSEYGKEIEHEIRKLGLEQQVILPGKIDEHQKQWLYTYCTAFLFPSLAEGFGLPVIEAMYEGKPVFLSTYTSLPEVGGPLASYFDSFDPDYMATLIKSKLQEVAKNPLEFKEQISTYASRFNWRNCIAQYIKLYQEIINEHPPQR